MGIIVSTDIGCDKCDQWTHGAWGISVLAKEARKNAERNGWGRVIDISSGHREFLDLCPKCWKLFIQEKEK